MTREEFMDLDDWYLVNVVGRPNLFEGDPTKGYYPVPRGKQPEKMFTGPLDLFMSTTGAAMRKAGRSEEEIQTRYQKWRPNSQRRSKSRPSR